MQSDRTKQRVAGALFLAAFLAYGFGTGMISGIIEANNPVAALAAKRTEFFVGAALVFLNSAIVAGIGYLLRPTLARHSRSIAWIYLAARLTEAAVLAFGIIGIASLVAANAPLTAAAIRSAQRANFFSYQIGMAVLGFASLFFCALLHRARLIPRLAAVWGFCGYAILLTGTMLELWGVNAGLLFFIPGGLFELFFGIWLMVKGFKTITTDAAPSLG